MGYASSGVNREGFSIGEAAAIVGVSTHVIRSWERRLSINLNHRTQTNQRRYWMQDVQRFIAIKRLHETGGLPLVESAARALKAAEDNVPSATVINKSDELDGFWAGLIDTLPELLLVIDGSGRIAAANEVARAMLNIRYGSPFTSLAPGGWRRTYNSLRRDVGPRRQPVLLAMRARTGIVFMNAQVVLLGRVLDGRAVFIGTRVRGPGSSESAVAREGSLHG